MRIYFAHPTSMYDTPVERELQNRYLQAHPGDSVENPNQPKHSEGYAAGGMDYFVSLCNQQDGAFFAPFGNGKLGAGVAKEVISFLDRNAPVYEFDRKSGDFRQVQSIGEFSVMSVDETRAAIRKERAESPYQSLQDYSQGWVA
ncbi:hypothetical protein JST97_02325 [bacterium]|nr:hypothetical protein [bacterium]